MTDKDSQLDEIERLAIDWNTGETYWIDPKLFLRDGLYNEMRRQLNALQDRALQYENERLRKENKQLRHNMKQMRQHFSEDKDD